MLKPRKLKPFKHLCMTIGNLPTSFVESMSYYECLAWLVKYLKDTVIPAVNENAQAVEELQGLFIQLQNFVEEYFENLDIQEEVDKKLDEMTINGEFAILLKNKYFYDEIEMTEGYYEDTNTHYFVIHVPYKDKTGKVINIKRGFANDNYVSTRPIETARHFSNRKNCTAVINASPFFTSGEHLNHIRGLLIHDGRVISDTRDVYDDFYKMCYILGIKEDNTLSFYEPFTPYEDILADGVKETITGFHPIMINGESYKDELEISNVWHTLTSKSFIGQNTETKDFYIICNNGKGDTREKGLDTDTVIEIYQELGVDFAYMLDSGTSSQIVYRNIDLNNNTYESGQYEKPVTDFIYFEKEIDINTDLSEKYEDIKLGDIFDELKRNGNQTGFIKLDSIQTLANKGIEVYNNGIRTNKLILNESQMSYRKFVENETFYILNILSNGLIESYDKKYGYFPKGTEYADSTVDIDNIEYSTIMMLARDITEDVPYTNSNCLLINFPFKNSEDNDSGVQIAIPFASGLNTNYIKVRYKVSGEWQAWKSLSGFTDWQELTNEHGNIYYKDNGKIVEILANVNNITTNTNLGKLPYVVDKQVVSICAGSGSGASSTFAKAFYDTDRTLHILAGTGTNATTYNIHMLFTYTSTSQE